LRDVTDRRVFIWSMPTHVSSEKDPRPPGKKLWELFEKANLLKKCRDEHYLIGFTNAEKFKSESCVPRDNRVLLVRREQLREFFSPSIRYALEKILWKEEPTQVAKESGGQNEAQTKQELKTVASAEAQSLTTAIFFSIEHFFLLHLERINKPDS